MNVLVARKAIQAIGKIALRLPGRANTCTHKLISLLSMEISHVTSEALVSLASELHTCMFISRCIKGTFNLLDVLREFDTLVEVILPHLPTSFKVITEEDGKSALIWMLGEYGEVIHVLSGVLS